VDRERIPYHKKIQKDSERRLKKGGPRDIQRRQNTLYHVLDVAALKMLLRERMAEEGVIEDGSQHLSFEEVRKKIELAVEFTRKEEAERFESSLNDLNSQLNTTKKKMFILEEQLLNKNVEIKKLKSQIIGLPQDLKSRLEKREAQLEKKDEIIVRLSENYSQSIDGLKKGLDNIAKKIIYGIVSSEDLERPGIDDKVFIDPLEGGTKLDPHIRIDAEKVVGDEVKRNVVNDIAKLRDLLNKSVK